MVHALQQAWRVLRDAGILIDLRPISVDTPLFILTNDGWISAGIPDQSPDRIQDLAAHRALHSVVRDGLLIRLKQKYFNENNYWDDLEDLREDVEERWKDDILFTEDIWRRAQLLFDQENGEKRIRFPFRKKISVYQKKQQKDAPTITRTG